MGHLIGMGELAVPSHRATAMAEYIKPKTRKQLRAFLGAVGYYRKFIFEFAKMSSKLKAGSQYILCVPSRRIPTGSHYFFNGLGRSATQK